MIGATNSKSQKSMIDQGFRNIHVFHCTSFKIQRQKLDLSTTVSWQIMCLLLLPTDCLWSEPDIKFIVSPDSPEIWRGETKYRIYEFLLSKILKVWFWILDMLSPLEGGHCVTQLKLYTFDKLSSTIFCCLSVSQASVTPDQISTIFQYIQA